MRVAKVLFILVVSFVLNLGGARGASIHWTNVLGGNWSDTFGWSPNQVPGPNDDAFITEAGTYTVSVFFDATAASLVVSAPSGSPLVNVNTGVTLTLSNLTLTGQGLASGVIGCTWIVNGLMTWTGGAAGGGMSGMSGVRGTPFNANGGIAISSSGATMRSTRTLNNAGKTTWTGVTPLIFGGPPGIFQGEFNNLAGAVFEAQNDSSMAGIFNNTGIFRKIGGTNVTSISAAFTNTGTVEVQSGTLTFASPLVQRAGSTLLKGGNITGNLKIGGGLLGGSGSVTGTVSMSGQLSPGLSAGHIEIVGDYIQGIAGAYNVEIGGTIAGTNFDQVSVTGNAKLAAAVNVCSINGFVPAPGDRFEIMKFGSLSGSMVFNGLDIAKGIRLEPIITSTNIVLVATNAPTNAYPALHLVHNGDAMWLFWPAGYGGFRLQSNTNLNFTNAWSDVSLTESNRSIFTPTLPTTFFRMISP